MGQRDAAGQRDAGAGTSTRALVGTCEYDGGDVGWVQATHITKVEVDLETGFVAILKYLVVEDCGDVINPAVVEGQVRGGVAQGVGAVYYEHAIYDEDANFRGVGEGGMIGAPAALTNAVEDALSHLGVKVREQHLPPTRILELAQVIETE